MYIVLSGAKKNAGDFLITDRAEQLLRHLRPEHDLLHLPGWEPLEPHLDRINAATGVIILGGPGLQPSLYPKIYKLTKRLEDIKVPIILMGSGWKAFPGDEISLKHFTFSADSLRALRQMSSRAEQLSCRDIHSVQVLKKHGINNALMTGCPVWYDLPSIGKPMQLPATVERLVYTPAQLPFYGQVSIDVAKAIQERFPNARRVCAFHRGISQQDEFTNQDEIDNNHIVKRAVEDLGYEVVDLSGSGEGSSVYDECQLHVGFRLHGHLYTLSKRIPSLLLHEDGRGIAASATLNLRGFDAFERLGFAKFDLATGRVQRAVQKRLGRVIADQALGERVGQYLDHLMTTQFAVCAGVGAVIDAHFAVMKRFLATLP